MYCRCQFVLTDFSLPEEATAARWTTTIEGERGIFIKIDHDSVQGCVQGMLADAKPFSNFVTRSRLAEQDTQSKSSTSGYKLVAAHAAFVDLLASSAGGAFGKSRGNRSPDFRSYAAQPSFRRKDISLLIMLLANRMDHT